MLSIIKSIICREFEKRVGKGQNYKDKPISMDITFCLPTDYSTEEGRHWLDIRIFAPGNYVGVIARERHNYYLLKDIIPSTDQYADIQFKKGKNRIKETTPWKRYSYHDSCWREDGVSRVLCDYSNKLESIGSFIDWYTKHEMTEQEIEEFRICINNK